MKRGFNSDFVFEINTNPGGTADYVRLGGGVSDITSTPNDVVNQKAYITDAGWGCSSVDGGQPTYSLSGDRILDDEAQNYILDSMKTIGNTRETNLQIYDGNGELTTLDVTIVNGSGFGGAANAPSAFTVELHQNGEAEVTPAEGADALTATAVLALGKVTITATPAVGNVIRYTVTGAAETTPNAMSSVLGGTLYKAPFKSTAGKYVNIFECKYDTKVVKFLSVLLV